MPRFVLGADVLNAAPTTDQADGPLQQQDGHLI